MRFCYVLSIVLILACPRKLHAQNEKNQTDTLHIKDVEIGEIVIKASRANIRLKEMHASVSLISSSFIHENEISTLNEISSVAPNLFIPAYGSKLTSPVYIRGIGSRINAPSVGLYVDNVPYFEKAAFDFDFFDIERIEVLRGPQGTLFGRNTMGGIINVFTLSPMEYQGTKLRISAGNYGVYNLSAGHYAKLNDKVAFSLAANYLHRDGYFTNEYSGNKVDKMNSLGLRTRLAWKISEKLSLENISGVEWSRQGGYPYALYNDSLNKAENVNYNQYSSYNRNIFSDALVLKYKTEDFEIISTSSYQFLDDIQKIDQDFTIDSLYFVTQTQKQHMFSQEATIRSVAQKKYSWLFGAYGFLQSFDNGVNVDQYVSGMRLLKQYDHQISGFAFFHQSSVSDFLIKNLTITGGIRLDFENDVLEYNYDRELHGTPSHITDTVYTPLRSFDLMPKIALNYKTAGSNFYVVIARGYKTGGFNSTFERPEDLTFDPENSWNYEAGSKFSFFRNRLFADIAFFYIDWNDQQIYQTVPSGRGSMLKNAGHSTSKGLEVTLRTVAGQGYEILLSYGYTHATFLSYKLNEEINYDGNYLPYVPRNTMAVQLNKTISFNPSSWLDKMRINILYRGAGKIYWNEENSHKQDYYGLLDAKVSFTKKAFEFGIWGSNLLDTKYEAFYFESLGNKYVQTGNPVHFGVNLSINF